MKDWYLKLKIEYQVVVWSLITIITLVLACLPCFFLSWMEIPQGIALGGGVSVIVYLFLGLFNNQENSKKSLVITVVIVTIKLLVIGLVLFLVGWLYYGIGFKAFNIFAVAGGYFIPLPIHLILARKERVSGTA